MIDGAAPKLVRYGPGLLVLALTVGGLLFGWLRGRGAPKGGEGSPLDGWLGDDVGHHHRWDGGNHDGHGGDAAHEA